MAHRAERHPAARLGRRPVVALVGATALGLAGCGAGTQAGGAAGAASADGFAAPGLLVAAAELRARPAKDTVVVDARPALDYEKGHIPGAVSLPVTETFDPAR